MNGTDIAGYLYHGQPFCPTCIYDLFVPFDLASSPQRSTEEILDMAAAERKLNRHDERSFTSREFPVPIYLHDVTGDERCLFCNKPLDPDYDEDAA